MTFALIALFGGALGLLLEWQRTRFPPLRPIGAVMFIVATFALPWPTPNGITAGIIATLSLLVERRWWRPMLASSLSAMLIAAIALVTLGPNDWRDGQLGMAMMLAWFGAVFPMLAAMYAFAWFRRHHAG